MANRILPSDRTRHKLQIEVNDLSGGFVSQAATYNIDNRFLPDIQNMEFVQGMWQKRKGYHHSGTYTTIDPVPDRVRGAHMFSVEGNLRLLVVSEQDLYASKQLTGNNSGTVFGDRIPPSKHVSFTDFRNECYIAHGEGDILCYNGATLRDVHSPNGNILATYDNRIILSGIKGDPLVLYFSEKGEGKEWGALNYIALDGTSAEHITALVPMIGKLYIFTNHSIYSLVGSMDNFSLSLEIAGLGAVSSSAIYTTGNRFYFVSEEYKIYEFDGGTYPKEISRNITHYLKSFPPRALENAVFTHHKDAVWITLDNSPLPEERITLVYYPNYGMWTKFKGIPAAAYIRMKNTLYFIGSHNIGSIYQYGTQYNDDFRAIDAHIKTSRWSFDALENIKRFKKLYVRGAIQGGGGNGFDVEFWIDNSRVASVRATSDISTETEIWGENQWGKMFWGSAAETTGSIWGQFEWGDVDWNGSEVVFSPRWGSAVWGAMKWGDAKEGSLTEDVGRIYRKIFLSQYNVISGKTLQLVLRDRTPHHGFRFENLVLEYVQKGAR